MSPALRRVVLDRVAEFDRVWSRFREDSVITRLARRGGSATFPEEARALFALYDRLHLASEGAVDPLVGRDLEMLGYDARYSLKPVGPEIVAAERAGGRPSWTHDIDRDGTTVSVTRPLVIDVGAAGKGLAVDIVGRLLTTAGLAAWTVDAGGDMAHRGEEPLRVGLEHPTDPRRVIGIVELQNGALCASSTTKRTWGPGLHHVLDGRTGLPTSGITATWVVAADAITADGVATALFSTPARRLAEHVEFSSVTLTSDGRISTWGDLPGEVYRRPEAEH
jgi:thiamine biosynthesis lipoprotein